MATVGTIEYQPEIKYGQPFGYGRYCELNPADITTKAIQVEALKLGWSNGCPRARFYVLESEYGAAWMQERYATTNFWFGLAINLIHGRLNNPRLYNLIALSKPRLPDEPVGNHELLSVPRSHVTKIAPMADIAGYSIPRILLEIPHDQQTRVEALQQAVILTGVEIGNFLAHLSRVAVDHGAKPERVLHHVYAQGVLDEENSRIAFKALAESLDRFAPAVWRDTYVNLPQSQRRDLEIAEIPS